METPTNPPEFPDKLPEGGKHFIRPAAIATCHNARKLAVRTFPLRPGDVVPPHIHDKNNDGKEKFYYVTCSHGTIELTTYDGEIPTKHELETGDKFVINPGVWHSLKYHSVATGPCEILVVTSSQDTTDIRWHPDTDALIKKYG